MGSFSIWHWLIVAFIVLLLFGGKSKLSNLMGDMGKGLRSFKENFKPEESKPAEDEAEKIAETDEKTQAPAPAGEVVDVKVETVEASADVSEKSSSSSKS